MQKSVGNTAATVSPQELRTEKLRALAHRSPTVADTGTSLRDAIGLMQQARGESLVVTRDGRPVGILTERDVLIKVLGQDVDLDGPVDDQMTREPQTISADARVGEALAIMRRGGFRNLPLVDGDG